MQYTLIEPPFIKPPAETTRKEAKVYFQWYVEQIPKRIAGLEQAIHSSGGNPEYQSWTASLLPESLTILGQWFSDHLVTAPPSEEFKEKRAESVAKIPLQYQSLATMPSYVLTDVSYSVVIDIGMYLGEALRKRLTSLTWQLWTRNSRDVDYHKPVLVGFNHLAEYEPERHIHVIARKLVDKQCDPTSLREHFDRQIALETEW
jgi:hypothetical protein